MRNELKYLDMFITAHPLSVLREEASRTGCIPSVCLEKYTGKTIVFAGIVAASRRIAARGKRVMQFVTLEDEHGLVEAVLLPGAYETLSDPVNNPGPYLMEGKVVDDRGDIHLLVSDVKPFHERREPYGKEKSLV
jgi:DNA polymerase III alpha subunit